MSEIEKEPVEQIKQVLKERISSPLWGYVFFAWLGFNWQNLAKLFMSNKPVEERIIDITSQSYFYVHFLVLPLLLGCVLAALSPYFPQWLSIAHKKAFEKQRVMDKEKIIKKYLDDAEIIEERVRFESVESVFKEKESSKREITEARKQVRLSILEMRKSKIDKSREVLNKEYEDAQSRLHEKRNELEDIDEKKRNLDFQYHSVAKKLNGIADVYFKYKDMSSHADFMSFLSDIKEKGLLTYDATTGVYDMMLSKELTPINAVKN
ncbi:hypothetical protein [Klebsiella variicola]|uniref:hypothetical protein n=1 Tax=Klebsiella variicola TaxID=244366 RepID=UPI002158FA95|nr:hypothetical protein [Klebsiella variicola]ELA2824573.1 hypothetical protein [Klebsiella variicola]EMA4731772.1 hypothetical protein [Klebsiella variicola]MCR8654309.1 hypothetical protein [Klebsiella variicola]WRS01089.1 hypothetical protein VNI85_23605 [Klebsiella variicola]